MSSDTIADMISQIKNATLSKQEYVELSHSKTREAVVKVLEEVGFVKDVKVFKESGMPYKSLHIGLIYEPDGESKIHDIKRVSKPGRRVYSSSSDIKHVDERHGAFVVSTSIGIISGQTARKKKLGGEVICEVK